MRTVTRNIAFIPIALVACLAALTSACGGSRYHYVDDGNVGYAAQPVAVETYTADTTYDTQAPEGQTVPSVDYFYAELSPYGSWVEDAQLGVVFVPNDNSYVPYSDGYWDYRDYGNLWVSNRPFGWAVCHYGRWVHRGMRWMWIPGTTWGPSWVDWRMNGSYVGWGPMGPSGYGYTTPARYWRYVHHRHVHNRHVSRHYVRNHYSVHARARAVRRRARVRHGKRHHNYVAGPKASWMGKRTKRGAKRRLPSRVMGRFSASERTRTERRVQKWRSSNRDRKFLPAYNDRRQDQYKRAQRQRRGEDAARRGQQPRPKQEGARRGQPTKRDAAGRNYPHKGQGHKAQPGHKARPDHRGGKGAQNPRRVQPNQRQQQDANRRAQQHKQQQDALQKARQDSARKAQQQQQNRQFQHKRQQQDAVRRAEQQGKQQDAVRRAQQQRKQQDAARAEQQGKQQDAARRAQQQRQQQDAARRAQQQRQKQDTARRAQQQRQKQDAARRAQQQRQKQDAARRAQQQRQKQDAARRAKQQRPRRR